MNDQITHRAYIATHTLAAIIAENSMLGICVTPEKASTEAVRYADALIAALADPKLPTPPRH